MISTTVPPSTTDISSLATASALATVDTVVDAIKAVTDNLPNSGALTNLDAAISSVYPAQTGIYVSGEDTTGLDTLSPGVRSASITGSATTLTVLDITSAAGILWWASCWRGSGYDGGTLNIKVTIDGSVAVLTTSASTATTLGLGVIGVGAASNSTAILMPIRFTASMKVELICSTAQSGASNAFGNTIYTLD